MNLAAHLYLVPRLRMSGVLPPLPYMSLWRAKGQLYFNSLNTCKAVPTVYFRVKKVFTS